MPPAPTGCVQRSGSMRPPPRAPRSLVSDSGTVRRECKSRVLSMASSLRAARDAGLRGLVQPAAYRVRGAGGRLVALASARRAHFFQPRSYAMFLRFARATRAIHHLADKSRAHCRAARGLGALAHRPSLCLARQSRSNGVAARICDRRFGRCRCSRRRRRLGLGPGSLATERSLRQLALQSPTHVRLRVVVQGERMFAFKRHLREQIKAKGAPCASLWRSARQVLG